DWKAFSFAAHPDCLSQQGLRLWRSPQGHRFFAPLQSKGAKQSNYAKHVVSVHVGKENVAEREARAVAHHLPLSSFAAVEHQRLALADYNHGADVALDCWSGC